MNVWACGEPLCKAQVEQDAPPLRCPQCGRTLLPQDDPEYAAHVDKGVPVAPLMRLTDGHLRPARREDMMTLLGSILAQQESGRAKDMRLLQTIIRISALAFVAAGVALLVNGMQLVGAVLVAIGLMDAVVAVMVGMQIRKRMEEQE